MKKLFALMIVLAMAGMANAALLLSVDGVVDPPDTEITIAPSDEVVIDIWGDGADPGNQAFWLTVEGLGSASGGVVLYSGDLSSIALYEAGDGSGIIEDFVSQMPGYEAATQAYYIEFATSGTSIPALAGTLVDEIILHCDGGPGDVLLQLANIDMSANLDTQIIHQIPEPMTVALLGLGGLLLRRRR